MALAHSSPPPWSLSPEVDRRIERVMVSSSIIIILRLWLRLMLLLQLLSCALVERVDDDRESEKDEDDASSGDVAG